MSTRPMKNQIWHRKSHEDGSFTFVVCGDAHVGITETEYAEIVKQVLSVRPDFIVFVGDMVTAGRQTACWDAFLKMSKEVIKNMPLYTALGNHEYAYHGGFDYSVPPALYLNLFQPPGNGLWYSFDYNCTHFVILNVPDKGHLKKGDEQYKWLVNDLQKANEEGKTVFVFQHCACFTSTKIDWAYDGSVLPDLLSSYKNVAIDFAGHIHTYERSIYPNKNTGKNFITTGGAGLLYPEYPVDAVSNPYQIAAAADILHFCKVSVKPKTSIDVEVITIGGMIYEKFVVDIREH